MEVKTETLEVQGVHCMQCIQTIASALGDVDGLAGASANLMGEVTIAYEEPDVRDAAVAALERAGFPIA
jgi:copper chaperone CopZ